MPLLNSYELALTLIKKGRPISESSIGLQKYWNILWDVNPQNLSRVWHSTTYLPTWQSLDFSLENKHYQDYARCGQNIICTKIMKYDDAENKSK